MNAYPDVPGTEYPREYSPHLLQPIPRAEGRHRLGIAAALPFSGEDIWNAYELSWLNLKGKPVAAIGEFRVPATSPNMVESKSLKLYLNSLNGTGYETIAAARETIADDLSRLCGADVRVRIRPADATEPYEQGKPAGRCIDSADMEISNYELDPQLLLNGSDLRSEVSETLYSNLLKTNCPVTGQPDWATVLIRYRGPKIRRRRLLAYLISYRRHAEFHEQCVERMFLDLQHFCQPRSLTVYARYLRRGGLDINPFRSNFEAAPRNVRLPRQ